MRFRAALVGLIINIHFIQYQIMELRTKCIEQIIDDFTPEEVISDLLLADTLSILQLRGAAMTFIAAYVFPLQQRCEVWGYFSPHQKNI